MRRPIPAPADPPPLQVALPLPAYRYVPGLQTHPLHGGHGGHGLPTDAPGELAFTRGLDLLAHRYPWEAHEALEVAWHRWRADGDPRTSLASGLIKLAAALLQIHNQKPRPAKILLARATEELEPFGRGAIPVGALLAAAHDFLEGGPWPEWPSGSGDQAAR